MLTFIARRWNSTVYGNPAASGSWCTWAMIGDSRMSRIRSEPAGVSVHGLDVDVHRQTLELDRVRESSSVGELVHLGDDRRLQDVQDPIGTRRRKRPRSGC